jgi:hypothetical protein
MHHVLNNNVSLFIQKHSVAKLLPTRHIINVFPRLNLLEALTNFAHLTVYLYYIIYNQQNLSTQSPFRVRT